MQIANQGESLVSIVNTLTWSITGVIVLGGLAWIGYNLYQCYKQHGKLNAATIALCLGQSWWNTGKNSWNDFVNWVGSSKVASSMVDTFAKPVMAITGDKEKSGPGWKTEGAKDSQVFSFHSYGSSKMFAPNFDSKKNYCSWNRKELEAYNPEGIIEFRPNNQLGLIQSEWGVHKMFGGKVDDSMSKDAPHNWNAEPLYCTGEKKAGTGYPGDIQSVIPPNKVPLPSTQNSSKPVPGNSGKPPLVNNDQGKQKDTPATKKKHHNLFLQVVTFGRKG